MERISRMARYLLNILIPVTGWILFIVLGPKLLRFFMPFVIGWILAMIANPLVHFLESHLKIVRKHGSVLIVVLVLAGVIGLLYLIGSRLVLMGMNLIRDLPQLYELAKAEVQEAWGNLGHLFVRFPLGMQNFFQEFWNNLGGYVSSLLQTIATPTVAVAGNVAKSIPAVFVSVIITVLSSYFFIAERETIIGKAAKYMPEWLNKYLTLLKGDIRHLVGGYFLAQFRIMFVVAAVLAAGFLILGVDYGPVFAVLIAFLDFLPMFGTGTALGPWALVKLLSGEYYFAAGLLLLYVLTQAVRQVIQPKIVGDAMGLPPLLTLFLLYLGFKVKGIAGMILAVPVGLLFVSLYRHGAFDTIVENGKLLLKEIHDFRAGGAGM
ncbi:MAG: sporulation integral membrane protein YtvI [Lachnospiraceae bacterium]|nr:sporulation integral membrane protein YtvI [Lachnospiraceae bacterium]MDO5550812.1 sporulation integral membrane protein YtvI [Lachnospiraceae bacterium]